MEAVIILFVIVILFALLSGDARSSGASEQRSATRSEGAGSRSTPATSTTVAQERGGSGLLPALIVVLTIVALMYNAG